ncbi:hypothetical protein [Arthrobacter sp. efr-133-TYG-120]
MGASGARFYSHGSTRTHPRGTRRAAAALCGGGWQGDAILLER